MAVMVFDNFEALAIHLRAASRATTPALQRAVQDAEKLVAGSAGAENEMEIQRLMLDAVVGALVSRRT